MLKRSLLSLVCICLIGSAVLAREASPAEPKKSLAQAASSFWGRVKALFSGKASSHENEYYEAPKKEMPAPSGKNYFPGMTNLSDILADNDCVAILFFDETSAPCKRFAPAFKSVSENRQLTQISFATVDVKQAESLADEYGINEYPTTVLSKKGKVVWRSAGWMPGNDLIKKIKDKFKESVK